MYKKNLNPFQFDLAAEGLLGRVRRMETEWVRFIDEISHTKTDTNIFKQISLFDASGKKIEETNVNPDGTISTTDVFQYDEQDRLVEKQARKAGQTIEWKWTYQHDIANQSVTERLYDFENNLVGVEVHYFENAVKTFEEVYDQDHQLIHKHVFEHQRQDDSSETIIRTFDQRGQLIKTRNYIYDAQDRLQDKFLYYASGMLEIREKFRYDERGNAIEEISYHPDGSIQYRYLHHYEFDPVGNWIKKQTHVRMSQTGDREDFLSEEYRRIIDYF